VQPRIRNPLIGPFVAFAAGILLARKAEFGASECLWYAVCFGLLAGVGAWWRKPWLNWTGVALCFAALGALDAVWQQPPVRPAALGGTGVLSGCVAEPAVWRGDQRQFTLEMHPGVRVRISTRNGTVPLEYGTLVEIAAKVKETHGFHNPGAFDLEEWMGRRGIFWRGTAPRDAAPRILPGHCGSVWRRQLERLRAAGLARIDSLYPGDGYHQGMMRGLLLGDKSGIRRAWIEDFRRTGTYHALVISGSHITLVCGLLLFLRRRYGLLERPLLVISAAIAWIYAMAAGGDAPVLRAAAGFSLFAVSAFYYREARLLNLLAAVALAFVAVDPDQLFDASFQLSFLAVAALGAFQWKPDPVAQQVWRLELRLIAETLQLLVRVPIGWCQAVVSYPAGAVRWAWEAMLLSGGVQVGLALPMAIYFHRLSLTGLTANLAAVMPLSGAIPFGFLAVFTGWKWAAWLAGWLLTVSQRIAAWHAGMEPSWRIPDPPLWLSLVLAGSLILLAARIPRGRWLWLPGVMCTAALALLIWHPFPPHFTPGVLELTAIDVGQGESLLVGLPNGRLVMVDGGGLPQFQRRQGDNMDIGEEVVSPYLWTRGVRRLDAIAVTHLHDDHAGGVGALIENFRPRELWVSFTPDSAVWRALAVKAQAQGVTVRVRKQGDRWALGGVEWRALAPAREQEWRGKEQNNDSLVLRLQHGRHTFLLTGDAEVGVQHRLMEENEIGHVDVLKVAHHGSGRSNSEVWLDTLRPAVALISAGWQNSYGLPSARVVGDLRRNHAYVLRTDQDGVVTVRSDGYGLSVERGR
jgi:competence protein ComEC